MKNRRGGIKKKSYLHVNIVKLSVDIIYTKSAIDRNSATLQHNLSNACFGDKKIELEA